MVSFLLAARRPLGASLAASFACSSLLKCRRQNHEKNCTIPWEIVQLLFVILPAG